MYGHLVLGASTAPRFTLNSVAPSIQVGDHAVSRYAGRWELSSSSHQSVPIPQRDKHLDVHLEGECLSPDNFLSSLATVDADYEGHPYRFKLGKLLEATEGSFVACVNCTGSHGSFSLLSKGVPLYVTGLFDPALATAHLVWSTDPNTDRAVRAAFPLQYLIYRFPVLHDGVIFLATQAVCAHWRKYQQQNSPLLCFNALELKLFKPWDSC